MIRVLHCIPTLLGGGAERQLSYLVAGLVAQGHEVHLAHQQEGPNFALVKRSGAHLHPLEARHASDPRAATDIARVLRDARIEIVQTWLRRMDIWGGLAARSTGTPWVFSERSQSVTIDERTASARTLRLLLPAARAVVANSETAAELWRRGLHGRVPVRVVANALPTDRIERVESADRRELGIPDGVPLALYAGRFTEGKNVPLLGQALARLMEHRPELHALFLGEGPELDDFRSWARAHGLHRRIVTPGYRDDLFRWMKAATLFVSPSRSEGRPNVVMEAMACRCPMVLSDIAPHREFVGEDEAAWCRTDDLDALAAALERTLDDPEAAAERAARASASVARFSIPAMVASYEAVYREILGHA